jgi:hypothetical protein
VHAQQVLLYKSYFSHPWLLGIGSCYIAQDDIELQILLPQLLPPSPKCATTSSFSFPFAGYLHCFTNIVYLRLISLMETSGQNIPWASLTIQSDVTSATISTKQTCSH